jgi:hypothetical protein
VRRIGRRPDSRKSQVLRQRYTSAVPEKSRVEIRVTSVGADDEIRNIAIILRNMFAVKRVRLRKISRENNESVDITSRGTRTQTDPRKRSIPPYIKISSAHISNVLWIKKFSQRVTTRRINSLYSCTSPAIWYTVSPTAAPHEVTPAGSTTMNVLFIGLALFGGKPG